MLMILFNRADAQTKQHTDDTSQFNCEVSPASLISDKGLIDFVRSQIPEEALALHSGYSTVASMLNDLVLDSISKEKHSALSAKENSVRTLMNHVCGIPDVYITPYTVIGTSISELLPKLQSFIEKDIRSKGYNTFGIHLHAYEHLRAVTLIFGRRSAEIQPLPKQVALNDMVTVFGELLPGFRKPQLFVTTPLGEIMSRNLTVKNKKFSFPVDFNISGKYTLQIRTASEHGEETLIQTLITLKEQPDFKEPDIHTKNIFEPREPVMKEDGHLANITEHFYEKINILRNQYHLPELVFHPKLKEMASLQSQKMSERNQLEHSSKSLKQRLRKQHVRVLRAGENIAQYASLDQPSDIDDVLKQFLESPSHRMNLLEPDFDSFGVSLERAQEVNAPYYLSVVFAQLN